MKKTALISVLLAGGLATVAAVAAPDPNAKGVTESTDPARVAEVERHAQALGYNGSANASGTEQATGSKPAPKHHSKHKASKRHGSKSNKAPKAEAGSTPAQQ
ncbi:hypothetical protein [Ideonella sp. BN130291]|uniref:hypothetical protein n=1 Tax=Ideonella sp. BN130291 TaxID=3112940 RepID=UPI002E272282|nr:hypothetical protein [Ideonella sp. BN130291]